MCGLRIAGGGGGVGITSLSAAGREGGGWLKKRGMMEVFLQMFGDAHLGLDKERRVCTWNLRIIDRDEGLTFGGVGEALGLPLRRQSRAGDNALFGASDIPCIAGSFIFRFLLQSFSFFSFS